MNNTQKIAEYIYETPHRDIPEEVYNFARMCLADWICVAKGAIGESAARVVYETTKENHQRGKSTLLLGGVSDALTAALCNGTLAHCLDFDDTHIIANTHTSAPVYAATLALGQELDVSEETMLRAFITGFEVSSKVGYGIGQLVTEKGWHCTGIFGAIGSAASACVLMGLNQQQIINALSAAATQASGFTASFGSMSKPFHAGKAAFNGIMGAKLAQNGFVAFQDMFALDGGFVKALIQDQSLGLTPVNFDRWDILQNSFKPYAACHLTHPAVDTVKEMLKTISVDAIDSIDVEVGELAMQVTGHKSEKPISPLDAKFHLKFCVALALNQSNLMINDFSETSITNKHLLDLMKMVHVRPSKEMGYTSARLTAKLKNGDVNTFDVKVSKGHPGNALGWDDMKLKFMNITNDESLWDTIFQIGKNKTISIFKV